MTISAEEFRSRLFSTSSTDPDDRPRCEQCGALSLIPRNGRGNARNREDDRDAPYRCEQCGEFVEGSG